MANEVIINIPGIGDVVAENAASEATLRDILSALGGRSGGGGSSGGGSGSNSGTNANNDAVKSVKKFADNVDNAGKKIVDSIESLARLNGSVTAAANVVGDLASNIPLFGKTLQAAFGAVAVAQTDLIKSYQKSTEAGASFAGSLNDFVANASYAGLTLNEYGQFVAANGESLRLLSDNTEEGAKRFSVLSKVLRETSNDLFSLGYSTDDLNKGIVQYIQNQQYYGNINKKSNADLVTGTKAYLLELDTLAKVTGQSRDKIANDLATLNVDTEFRSFIDSLGAGSEKAGKELEETLGSVGPKMSSFMKDMITHGVPTTDENAAIMSVFPKLAAEALKYRQELQRGTANEDSRQRLMNTAAKESVANSKGWMNSVSGFADSGLKGARDLTSEGVKLSEDMRKSALDAQDKDLQSKENLIKSYSDFQKKITEVGNTFTNVLAHSGVFDTMTTLFELLAGTIKTVSIPLFNAFGFAAKAVTDQLSMWLTPALHALSDLAEYIPSILREALSPLGALLKEKFGGIFDSITGITGKASMNSKETAAKIAEWIGTAVNTGYAYFRKFWVALEEVAARVQLYALSMDTMKMTVLRFLIAMDTVADWFGVSGAKEAKARHESQLGLEEALFVLAHKERKEKEDELHRTISDTTKKYKEINDELANLNSKVKENAQNVKPEGAAPAGQAAEEKNLQGDVDATKSAMATAPAESRSKTAYKISMAETGGLNIPNRGGSTAGGLYQFTNSTWKGMTKELYGHALDPKLKYDPKIASEVMEHSLKQYQKALNPVLHRPANSAELYMTHFLGTGGGPKFMKNYMDNPNQLASPETVGKKAYESNIDVFAPADKSGKRHTRTLGGVYNEMASRLERKPEPGSVLKPPSEQSLPTAEPAKPVAPETTKPELPTAEPVTPGYMYEDNGEGGMFKTNLETTEVTLASPAEIASYKNSMVNQSPLNNIASDKQARDEEFKKQQDDRVAAEAEAAEKQKQAGSNTTAGNNPVQGSDQNSDFFNGLLGSMNSIAKNTAEANDIGQQQVSATRGVSGNLYAH